MRLLCLALSAALALHPALAFACDPPPLFDGAAGTTGVSVSVGSIAGVIWVPLEIDNRAVPEGAGLALEVGSDGMVTGTTGCNRFTGRAEVDAGVMQVGPLAVTEMACADPAAMAREAALLRALGEVRGFVVSPQGLWLTREDGSVALCLG